ncbi:MAG TPA: hypothetical protein VLH10_05990 [Yinghuangia sp.]|uniref:hypothetical protein n=1 Tax=Yinghuangia sp. YIM S10712 TaxID=3436930 RepID=UPI002BB4BC43|nr:hypothetical protein [Yinghuangia sp.]
MTTEKSAAVELTDAMTALVRVLVYATVPPGGPGFTQPGDAHATLGNLSTATMGLPQAFRQIDEFLTGLLADGRLQVDGGSNAAPRVIEVHSALENAADYANALSAALGRAQAALESVSLRDSFQAFAPA